MRMGYESGKKSTIISEPLGVSAYYRWDADGKLLGQKPVAITDIGTCHGENTRNFCVCCPRVFAGVSE
jgi:hypothetical protein